ncbi:MAG: hypothetical protein MJ132_06135 [Clostridia bacterium]|nr:hypothetical protein [Clostridia bacterium]
MKKFAFVPVFVLLFALCFSMVCYAWNPSKSFDCYIDYDKIPENTAYVDMLIPLKDSDKNYTAFNQVNGEKFNISSDSEIVHYNKGGYVSYTFHFKDSVSEFIPYHWVDFYCTKDVRNANAELFQRFLLKDDETDEERDIYLRSTYLEEEGGSYNAMFPLNSEYDKEFDRLLKDADIEYSDFFSCFVANHDSNQYAAIKKNCKTIKFAYVDKAGNVLMVSNAAKINAFREKFVPANLDITLHGKKLDISFSYGPPFYLLVVLPFIPLTIILISVIFFIVRHIKERKQKNII